MYRRVFISALLTLAAVSCDRTRSRPPVRSGDDNGWVAPPRILSVTKSAQNLVIRGETDSDRRIVLRSSKGEAYAAMADRDGGFVVSLPRPSGHVLYHPEVQNGESAVLSPEVLLVVDGGNGPLALLRAGGPSLRLGSAPILGSVDADESRVLLSGQLSAADGSVRVTTERGTRAHRLGPDGKWTVAEDLVGPQAIQVEGQSFAWPGRGDAVAGQAEVDRAGQGWRVNWLTPGGGHQSTWLPDAPPT